MWYWYEIFFVTCIMCTVVEFVKITIANRDKK